MLAILNQGFLCRKKGQVAQRSSTWESNFRFACKQFAQRMSFCPDGYMSDEDVEGFDFGGGEEDIRRETSQAKRDSGKHRVEEQGDSSWPAKQVHGIRRGGFGRPPTRKHYPRSNNGSFRTQNSSSPEESSNQLPQRRWRTRGTREGRTGQWVAKETSSESPKVPSSRNEDLPDGDGEEDSGVAETELVYYWSYSSPPALSLWVDIDVLYYSSLYVEVLNVFVCVCVARIYVVSSEVYMNFQFCLLCGAEVTHHCVLPVGTSFGCCSELSASSPKQSQVVPLTVLLSCG